MDAPIKSSPALNTEKAKALQAALAQIEKQFGKGTIMKLGAGEVIEDIQVVSTGSLGLDIALGVGGLPRGRVIEIYGPESSGKTTLTLQVIAEMQKVGGTCAFVDAEHALDIQYAQKLGVNLQELLISQPDTGEQALEIVDSLTRSGAVDLIVVDSVAALTPKAELEGEMGDSLPGLQARLMSQALRKLTASIKKANCMVIFINQIRMKIGVMFGSPETASRWSKTRWRHRSRRLNLTFCTAKASAAWARCSTWAWPATSLKRPAPGTPSTAKKSARAATTRVNSSRKTRRSPSKSKTRCASRWAFRRCKPLSPPM